MSGLRIVGAALSLALLGTALPVRPSAATPTSPEVVTDNWIPGIAFVAQPVTPAGVTVTPDLQVVRADGSPRTYLTQPGQLPTPWALGLPIYQGDRVRLNVLVATGGAPLQTLIVRLDNKDQILPAAAPWVVPIDTTQLSQGVHFIEAWALTAGPSPYAANRSADSTLTFEVVPPKTGGDGSGGPVVDPGPTPVTPPDPHPITPPTPEQLLTYSPQLKGQTPNPQALISLRLRRSVDSPESLGPVPSTLLVTGPRFVSADRPNGSMATRYWYAIVRDAAVEVVPQSLLETQTDRLQLFPYVTDPKSPGYHRGLHPGVVRLYIWGVDRDNHPGPPVVTTVNIAG